ncbi:hypothetical protein [Brevibacillus migulae]|uniref:hypothetical protein n=1 Tax=Brevibacillus migulae TaxID=1644114 RepID=UPI00106EFDFC|nr:hypothetical protein [Brevibacillus migulae]
MHSILKIGLLLIMVVLVPMSFIPSTAHACSCDIPDTAKEAMDRAAAVFVGTVTSVKKQKSGFDITFAASKSWKGPSSTEIHVFSPYGSCQYNFVEGTAYLVYASSWKNSKLLTVYDCGRTAPLPSAQPDIDELDYPDNTQRRLGETLADEAYLSLFLPPLLRITVELVLK